MNLKSIIKTAIFSTMLLGTLASCEKNPQEDNSNKGTIVGTVVDNLDNPVDGVTVTIKDVEGTAVTGADGTFTFKNVPVAKQSLTFTKAGYLTVVASVAASKFNNDDKTASVNVVMQIADAKIIGRVLNSSNSPMSGVAVSVSESKSTVTGADGKFELADLLVQDYTLTIKAEGNDNVTKPIASSVFVDKVADAGDIIIGASILLPGLTVNELKNADKWYYNEYRGGRNSDDYPHFDWSTDYLCTFEFHGNWGEGNEGTRLETAGDGAVDERNFTAFVYGSKMITADNCILSVRTLLFGEDNSKASAAKFGVQVIDLNAAVPANEIAGTATAECYDGDKHPYQDFEFDLSKYNGREVIVAVGLYKDSESVQKLFLRRLAFGKEKVTDNNWVSGTAVSGLDGWHMTQEILRSTMVNTEKKFTGVSPVSGDRGNYQEAYQSWRGLGHIAKEWASMPVAKDPEVFPSEGYLIKTRGGGTPVDLNKPEYYFYSKFAIASGCNNVTFKTRTFGGNSTFFKLTAITEDGSYKSIKPKSFSKANDEWDSTYEFLNDSNTIKFRHDHGGAGAPEEYATFTFDLSEYNGKNVVLCIGVYKGENNGDENKLVLYSFELN